MSAFTYSKWVFLSEFSCSLGSEMRYVVNSKKNLCVSRFLLFSGCTKSNFSILVFFGISFGLFGPSARTVILFKAS